jgi:hypothetical protein
LRRAHYEVTRGAPILHSFVEHVYVALTNSKVLHDFEELEQNGIVLVDDILILASSQRPPEQNAQLTYGTASTTVAM